MDFHVEEMPAKEDLTLAPPSLHRGRNVNVSRSRSSDVCYNHISRLAGCPRVRRIRVKSKLQTVREYLQVLDISCLVSVSLPKKNRPLTECRVLKLADLKS